MASPIDAVPTFARQWIRPPLAAFHMSYRGFAARPHEHEEAQVLVPLAGRMHLLAGGRAHMLAPGSMAWIPPGLPHGFVHVDGQLEFLAVEVLPVPGELAAVPADRPLVARAPGIALLARAAALELEGDGEVVAGCLGLLLRYLQAGPGEEASSPEVAIAVNAILADYASPLRVPQLAAMAGLSPRQLERRFAEELGRTPKRFLMEVRVGAADRLLRETGWAIARIALETGFQTPSHFTETFRSLTGTTPAKVRSDMAPGKP